MNRCIYEIAVVQRYRPNCRFSVVAYYYDHNHIYNMELLLACRTFS